MHIRLNKVYFSDKTNIHFTYIWFI